MPCSTLAPIPYFDVLFPLNRWPRGVSCVSTLRTEAEDGRDAAGRRDLTADWRSRVILAWAPA